MQGKRLFYEESDTWTYNKDSSIDSNQYTLKCFLNQELAREDDNTYYKIIHPYSSKLGRKSKAELKISLTADAVHFNISGYSSAIRFEDIIEMSYGEDITGLHMNVIYAQRSGNIALRIQLD